MRASLRRPLSAFRRRARTRVAAAPAVAALGFAVEEVKRRVLRGGRARARATRLRAERARMWFEVEARMAAERREVKQTNARTVSIPEGVWRHLWRWVRKASREAGVRVGGVEVGLVGREEGEGVAAVEGTGAAGLEAILLVMKWLVLGLGVVSCESRDVR